MHRVSDEAVETVYREEWGRIVATLIRLVGDFEVAEEAAQEAFTAAVDQWRVTGVPEFPRAWIIQTARHKAIDRLRRDEIEELSHLEKLVLQYTDAMTEDVLVPDALYVHLDKAFDAKTLVELTATIAGYNMVSRFVVATGVEME